MYRSKYQPTFTSILAHDIEQYLAEKRVFGCKYETESRYLQQFDHVMNEYGITSPDLPRDLIDTWISKRPNESPQTQASRCIIVRQFTLYLKRQGHMPYVPTGHLVEKQRKTFVPYIFNQEEIHSLFTFIDQIRADPRSLRRTMIIPLVFRLLYGCGLRLDEALQLHVQDVDQTCELLTIRQTKFLKDRLVPVAPSVTERLREYCARYHVNSSRNDWFFPAPDGGVWSERAIYDIFRQSLHACGIPHGGRNRGPRLHDFRHTFACHRLAHWLKEGMAVDLALPILATYLGHESIYRTQLYLHLFPQLYPDITSKLTIFCGTIIPTLEVTP